MDEDTITILIVDDEESIRDSMRFHLEDLGYNVLTAESPALCPVYGNGHCTAGSRCADVIFIDQHMPGMTGLEFLRLQAERGCKLSPQFKLLMTGAVSDEILALAAALGCRVEQKPLTLDAVEAFVLNAKAAGRPINKR